jgi:hypothetical protein
MIRKEVMKKVFLVVFVLTVAVYGMFAQTGTIREVSGEVELKVAGSDTFVAAKAGDVVALNTIVSTGFRSTAIIEIGSSVITVRALTRLSLAEIQRSQGTETINVDLQAGRVRVDVNPPAGTRSDFTVQSPSATASVRGTSFDFDTLNLSVKEGTVSYSGTAGAPPTMVSAGAASFVTNGLPANPVSVMADDLLPPLPVGTPGSDTQTQPSPPPSGGDLNVSFEY